MGRQEKNVRKTPHWDPNVHLTNWCNMEKVRDQEKSYETLGDYPMGDVFYLTSLGNISEKIKNIGIIITF